MPEYLIRTSGTHEWPGVHRSQLADVLAPPGSDCVPVEGWGDFRMRCGAAEVSFSGEDVGWQVSIEGPMDDSSASALIGQIAERVAEASGEACEWLQISW